MHVSGLLHALVAMNPSKHLPVAIDACGDEEEAIPVTSLLCQWKQPRKQKEKALKIGEAVLKSMHMASHLNRTFAP